MALTEDQIVQRVSHEFMNSLGAQDGDISIERGRAYDYYQRKLFGNEEEGESRVVTSDVQDVIDGTMPSLLRIFTTGDNLLTFDPVGPEDEGQASQASDYVNYIFFKRQQNPGAFELMFNWMFDALLQKNGYVKAYWDESEETTTENYSSLTLDELMVLLDDEELEPIERDERIEPVPDPVSGELVPDTVYDVKFRRTTTVGRPKIVNVPPEEMRISVDARNLSLINIRMVGQERFVTRSELKEMFWDDKEVLKKIDDLPKSAPSIDSDEKRARRDKSDDQRITTPSDDIDKSLDQFCLREAYMLIDVDEDGKSEFKQVFTVDEHFLWMDDADRQPFHALCPHPLPHKHMGMASAEKAMQDQMITSTLLRQILNNLYRTNQPGAAVWEKGLGEHTMSDLLTRKVGRIARFKRPVQESYQPDVIPFTAGESFPMLEYFDKKRRERTGITADGEALSPEALKHIQRSVMADAADDSKSKIETIARIFAETGFKSLFLHLHELVLKHQNREDIIKLRGQWVPVDPTHWRHRRDMTVQVGLGVGTRQQNLLHLEAIWEKQRAMVEAGGMNLTVTPKNIFHTASEMVKNANYKDPLMFFTDPGDAKAPPPSDEQQQLQQQQMQLEERRQQLDAQKQQLDAQKLQLKAQEDAAKHQREMLKIEEQRESRLDKFEIENEQLRNALSEMGIKLNISQADAVIKQMSAEAQADLAKAQAQQARAQALATLKDDAGKDSREERETQSKVRKTDAEIARLQADIRKTEEEIEKLRTERRATEVEIRAAESGIDEMLDGDEPEGTE